MPAGIPKHKQDLYLTLFEREEKTQDVNHTLHALVPVFIQVLRQLFEKDEEVIIFHDLYTGSGGI